MRRFNTTGTCFPELHYMVNIDRQVEAAAKIVRQGDYFCINRGRQYGKTTTLSTLAKHLENEFCVFNISFEGLGDASFATVENACAEFLKILRQWSRINGSSEEMQTLLKSVAPIGCKEISSTDFIDIIDELCNLSKKPLVVMIDEVDQASNNDGFIKFLGVLRKMYLSRNQFKTFQSVILAGVYDIKNLKLRIRTDEDHQFNSPWNIAVPFVADMSLHEDGIAEMLKDYAADRNLTFDFGYVAKEIYSYTAGYPFLVSRMCQIIDETSLTWDKEGILASVNMILKEENTLFDDLIKKLNQFPKMKELIRDILYSGIKKTFSSDEQYLQLAKRFNFLTETDGYVSIACRLMETRLYNLFISEAEFEKMFANGQLDKSQFVHNGHIDMRHLLEKFVVHFNEIFRSNDGSMDQKFLEDQGRKQFLLYLRPIINGIGNYYCEATTRDMTRTDVIVDYLGKQYIIELKIWHGNAYNERGEQQLSEYLDYYHLQTGYMVSFCFNKNKQPGVKSIAIGNRTIVEAVV